MSDLIQGRRTQRKRTFNLILVEADIRRLIVFRDRRSEASSRRRLCYGSDTPTFAVMVRNELVGLRAVGLARSFFGSHSVVLHGPVSHVPEQYSSSVRRYNQTGMSAYSTLLHASITLVMTDGIRNVGRRACC